MTKDRRSYEQTSEASRLNDPSTVHPTPNDADPDQKTKIIRELNDRLRTTGSGGMYLLTNGIAALSVPEVATICGAMAAFTDFTPDNDPHGEHDCAVMQIGDHRIIWKIDYYDRDRIYGSPDPANPAVTTRILTIMLAEEY